MLSERFESFLRGSVRFSVSGGFTAQFLSLCNQNNIRLMQMKTVDGGIRAVVFRDAFEKVSAFAEKSGAQLTVHRRKGMPFVLHRYRLRWGIMTGIVLGAMLVGVLSSMVWQVQINGCENISEEYIRSFFEEMGVKPGVLQTSIDIQKCRDRALTQMEAVSWVTVYLKGCIACIEVRERAPVAEQKEQECSNLVASYGGEIIRADVYAGHGYVKVGQAVAQGDLLVGGGIVMKNGAFRLVNAKADIEARTERTISLCQTQQKEVSVIEKATVVNGLCWFGLQIPFQSAFGKEKCEESQTFADGKAVVLPVGLFRRGHRKTTQRNISLSENITLLQTFSLFALEQMQVMQNKRILEREVTVRREQNGVSVQARYVCEENICTVRELYFDGEQGNEGE